MNEGLTNRGKVTEAWQRIHADHPDVHQIQMVKHINRMNHRDFGKLISEVCRLPQGSKILEAGCGSGRDIFYFATCGYNCTALDISNIPLYNLKKAKDFYNAQHQSQSIALEVWQADFFSLPFGHGAFDLVFNSGVVEHYDEQTRMQLLAELCRVTHPNGFVCVVFPNREHLLDGVWGNLVSRFSDHDKYDIPEQFITPTIQGEMKSVGLEPVVLDWIDCYDTISHYPN